MKKILNYAKIIVVTSMCSLAVYAFAKSSVYSFYEGVLRIFESNLPVPRTITPFGPIILLTGVLFLVLLSLPKDDESVARSSIFFSAALYIFSVLPNSEINWLDVLDVNVRGGMSLMSTVLIGVSIISGYVFLYFIERVEEGTGQLRERGANEEEVRKLGIKKTFYLTGYVLGGFCLALFSIAFVKLFWPALVSQTIGAVPPILACGISLIGITLVLAFYLLSETEKKK